MILISGIAMVFLEFGGFGGVPSIHRGNMALGIPAIALYVYLYFVPWQRFRRAISAKDWTAAKNNNRQAQIIMAVYSGAWCNRLDRIAGSAPLCVIT